MTIKHLVISGGGPNILQLYGALKYLHQKNIWSVDNIQSIHATSAGSLVSLLFMLKIEFENIDNYVINRPWDTLFQISAQQLLQLITTTGIFTISALIEFLAPLFKCKEYSIDITLQELYEVSNIEFYTYTSCLNSFEGVTISYKTHPNMRVIEAVYSSISIPCLFEPFKYEDNIYFDGGMFSNYPLNKCIELLESNNSSNTDIDYDEILGICNVNDKNIITDTNKLPTIELSNIFDYFFEFIKRLMSRCNTTETQYSIKYELQLVFVPFTLSTWNDLINSKDTRRNSMALPIEVIDKKLEDEWKPTTDDT